MYKDIQGKIKYYSCKLKKTFQELDLFKAVIDRNTYWQMVDNLEGIHVRSTRRRIKSAVGNIIRELHIHVFLYEYMK